MACWLIVLPSGSSLDSRNVKEVGVFGGVLFLCLRISSFWVQSSPS